jgi:hypothetical protein
MAPELAPGPQAEPPKKKCPYVRPSFKYERVFKTNALSCGKVGVTQAACRNNRTVSCKHQARPSTIQEKPMAVLDPAMARSHATRHAV